MLEEASRIHHLHEFDLSSIFKAFDTSGITPIFGLSPASLAVLITQLQTMRKPMLVLGSDDEILEKIRDNVGFFSADLAERAAHIMETTDSIYSGAAENKRQNASRLRGLFRLATRRPTLIFSTFESYLRRCIPKGELMACVLRPQIGDELDAQFLRKKLRAWGYSEETEVDMPGTFAIRGSIIDVFSPALDNPIRIERFGDEIDDIRTFNVATQKTIAKHRTVEIIAANEHLMDETHIECASNAINDIADRNDIPSKNIRAMREKICDATPFWGQQALTPAYFESMACLEDYLPNDCVTLWLEPDACITAANKKTDLMQRQYENAKTETPFICMPSEHRLAVEDGTKLLLKHKCFTSGLNTSLGLSDENGCWYEMLDNRDLVTARKQCQTKRSDDYLKVLAERISDWQNIYGEIAFTASSQGSIERIRAFLRPLSLKLRIVETPFSLDAPRQETCDHISLYLGNLTTGFRSPALRLALISESELLGTRPRRTQKQTVEHHTVLNSFKDLKPGDFVVHNDHGIGQYQGLVTLEIAGIKGDFLHITYADSGKLYIPVQRLKCIQKYAGAEKPRRLDKLGGGAWERTKQKVREHVRAMAIDLLDLYAKRQSRKGFAFSPRDSFFEDFENDFQFTETPDQLKAIDAVLQDMQKPRPMERLICGDVGFGKTEVAMRAAMRAVLDAKQVAVLVPTTILAEQHLETFMARFQNHPVHIEALDRFRKPKETKQILEDLSLGKVDIIIGTHRLLSKDVVFKNLGLLIIDEEHRFGVTHKEKIKALAESIDCLTMTATPIPRTFQMCLGGIKDLSVIETPPMDRLSIHTFVAKESDILIREAIERELNRGGQVYFLHNRVEDLDTLYQKILSLVPNAKIGIAHGQMDEKSLEKAMFDFIHHDLNVLLCTTIIESGIDIPSANCLIVSHAENFGLAQLYQIRGRVGRSSARAYCYLLTGREELSSIARERLNAIERLTDLGSGIEIAYLDLEMRGCGNLLGPEQSGNIASVGLEMYGELLRETVADLQGMQTEEKIEAEVNLPYSAYLPDSYIEDIQLRLLFYKRLSNAETTDELYETFGEILDRFGPPPKEALALKDMFELKIMLSDLGIRGMDANHTSIILDVGEKSHLDPAKLISLITLEPKKYAFRNDQKFVRYLTHAESDALVETAALYLEQLKSRCFDESIQDFKG